MKSCNIYFFADCMFVLQLSTRYEITVRDFATFSQICGNTDLRFGPLVFISSHEYQYTASVILCIHAIMNRLFVAILIKTHNKTTQTVSAAEHFSAAAGSFVCRLVNYRLSQMHCWFTVGQSLAQTYSPIIPPWHVIIIYDLWRLLKVLTWVKVKYDLTKWSDRKRQNKDKVVCSLR